MAARATDPLDLHLLGSIDRGLALTPTTWSYVVANLVRVKGKIFGDCQGAALPPTFASKRGARGEVSRGVDTWNCWGFPHCLLADSVFQLSVALPRATNLMERSLKCPVWKLVHLLVRRPVIGWHSVLVGCARVRAVSAPSGWGARYCPLRVVKSSAFPYR